MRSIVPSIHAGIVLWIQDAMQVEGERLKGGLTQHHVELTTMMRLVIEKVGDGHAGALLTPFALAVGIHEGSIEETRIHPAKEFFDPGVFLGPRGAQVREVME